MTFPGVVAAITWTTEPDFQGRLTYLREALSLKICRDFIDIREKEESIKRSNDNGRSLMNRRNNEAGRKVSRFSSNTHNQASQPN